jgi:hypothetical protein
MSWRDLFDDASDQEFISDFSPCPVTDRTPGLHRHFTCNGGHLAALLARDPGRSSRSGRILQAFRHAQCLQVDPLQSYPSVSPETCGVNIDGQLASNLRIGVSLR